MAPIDLITKNPAYRSVLPSHFLWGCASASYQIEGSIDADGKGRNVWDELLKNRTGQNGEDACDSYRQWKADVELLKAFKADVYRFSISWARIRPTGSRDETVNEAGIKYYSDLVDALLEAGIQPAVTIFHWDHPIALEQKYGGFLDRKIVEDFVAYAKVLFERLGDRVKLWITINEPHIFTMLTKNWAAQPWDLNKNLPLTTKHLLLCHARSVDLYRKEFQPAQNGRIGITLDCDWAEPINDSVAARSAAQRSPDYCLGLYAEPIYRGRLPDSIVKDFGLEAWHFSDEEWRLIQGSSEFFGLNHYGTEWATGEILLAKEADEITRLNGCVKKTPWRNGELIGLRGEDGHPYMVPWGFRKLLNYVHENYAKPHDLEIIVTENGFPVEGEEDFTLEQQLNDLLRQQFYASYIEAMLAAVKEDGVRVGGYTAWSLLE